VYSFQVGPDRLVIHAHVSGVEEERLIASEIFEIAIMERAVDCLGGAGIVFVASLALDVYAMLGEIQATTG
jgi:hypothetical protein